MTRKLRPGIHLVNIKGKRRKVRVNAKGQWRFMKMGRSSTTPRSRSSSRSRRTGVRRLPRRKRRRKRKRTIAVLPIIGSGAGLFMSPNTTGGGVSPFENIKQGNFKWAIEGVVENYTGFNIHDGTFRIEAAKGLVGAVVGVLAHKALNMLGVNRAFANLPAPLNKLRL